MGDSALPSMSLSGHRLNRDCLPFTFAAAVAGRSLFADLVHTTESLKEIKTAATVSDRTDEIGAGSAANAVRYAEVGTLMRHACCCCYIFGCSEASLSPGTIQSTPEPQRTHVVAWPNKYLSLIHI